jgi:hypothetical protein
LLKEAIITRTPGQLSGIEGVQLKDTHWVGRTWAQEAEESPLLTTVRRKWLLKTLRAAEDSICSSGL